GFKQYLMRALRDGCTPMEIIDALLMAFPALGLAKIVWATEILLDMDIPEFRPENLDAEAGWHDVAAADAIPQEQAAYFEVDGRHVFTWRKADEIHVYDSRCPHQVTDIPHLSLEGKTLTCPKHHWAFDIETGQCIDKGSRPLRRFEHKIENGRLLAWW
ncbi:MAG: carboxymuconolactone decarboxylase, partial [Gammaproteobacteria bacterium]